jgi:hypothetical protein
VAADERVRSFHTTFRGSVLLACFWCVSAVAASNAGGSCDPAAPRLQNLRVAVENLALQPTDLPVTSEKVSAAPEAAESAFKAAVPILLLAPHIAEMLNEVFDSDEADTQQIEVNALAEPPTVERASPTVESSIQDLPRDVATSQDDATRFQHQMYRKDI